MKSGGEERSTIKGLGFGGWWRGRRSFVLVVVVAVLELCGLGGLCSLCDFVGRFLDGWWSIFLERFSMLLERSAYGDYAFGFRSHDDSLRNEGILLRNVEEMV